MRRFPRQAFVKNGPHRPQIGAQVEIRERLRLLGGHVEGRPQDDALAGERGVPAFAWAARDLGDAEVDDLDEELDRRRDRPGRCCPA